MSSFFDKKKILITGASYGLGAVVAQELGELGAELILTARSKDKLEKVLNNLPNKTKHTAIPCDFQSNQAIKKMCEKILLNYHNLDIIMHIAGGGLGIKDPMPIYDEYMKVLKLNLLSILEINRQLIPLMRKNETSSIFHVGSIASNEAVGSISYNIAKVGLVAYVRSLSNELRGTGIIVNGISPGAFECEGNAMNRLKDRNLNAYKEFIEKKIPSRKMTSAKELLPLILLLIGKNNHIFNGNMVSCENGEGKFYKTI